MPVLSWAHSQYWGPAASTVVAAPPGPTKGGYPGWQGSVVSFGPLGLLSAWWGDWKAWVVSWVRLCRRIAALPQARRFVLLRTLQVLESPVYPHAKRAVRETATTIGFRNPEAWVSYSRAMKADPKKAENIWRSVRARELTQQHWAATQPGSTLTKMSNPHLALVAELAYQEYARAPWGDV